MAKTKPPHAANRRNIYMESALAEAGMRRAEEVGFSFSELLSRLLAAELKRKRGIAHLHAYKLEGSK
jgi:hypothetical protein